MKFSNQKKRLLASAILALSVISCTHDKCEQKVTYDTLEPIYMSYEDMRSPVQTLPSRELQDPGKLYFYGTTLFINEIGKGIHVIDNSNPSSPTPVSFIEVKGNIDMAVRNNILYADNYIDLVAIDISDISNVKEAGRLEGVFDYPDYPIRYGVDSTKGVVKDWKVVTVTDVVQGDCNGSDRGVFVDPQLEFDNGTTILPNTFASPDQSGSGGMGVKSMSNTSRPGVAGSTARFAIIDKYLYSIGQRNMRLFDLSNPSTPTLWTTVEVGREIETIFPYNNHLFIGSTTGMHIFNNSNPAAPFHVSTYQHIRQCDPVVVQDNRAYVTLRSGRNCGGFRNQLDVIDVSNLSNPTLIKSFEMSQPHGLGIDESTLFICEADSGLKVFDASDDQDIDVNQLAHFKSFHAYDVIPYNNVLMVIGQDGFYQYDYSDPANLQLLSSIQVPKP